MRRIFAALALAGLAVPTAAAANIVQQDDRGFRVMHVTETDASPDEVWRTIGMPSLWWSGQHSYSGDADNFSLEMVPGGCFCETSELVSVEHARVVYLDLNKGLRMRGALGPLQQDAVTGVLTIALGERTDGGTRISFEYSVGGNFRSAIGTIANAVDAVITQQADRLADAANDAPRAVEDAPEEEIPIEDRAPDAAIEGDDVPEDTPAIEPEEIDDFGATFDDTPEPRL